MNQFGLKPLKTILALATAALLSACGGSGGGGDAPAAQQPSAAQPATPIAIVTVGNSITSHAPSASIGWSGNWGMAASSDAKDYSAQFADLVSQSSKRQTTLARFNVSPVETEPGGQPSALVVSSALAANIVVVELGDNVDQSALEKFRARYSELLKLLHSPSAILVCTSTYWPRSLVSSAMRAACQEAGGTFVDLGAIQPSAGADASYLLTASEGVKKHPGDVGMKKIAEAIHSQIANSSEYVRLIMPK